MMAKTVEQMWKELKARGWEIHQSVNYDGDPYTSLLDPKGNSHGTVDGEWVSWKAFQKEIKEAWRGG
jgi:hypothetical protein